MWTLCGRLAPRHRQMTAAAQGFMFMQCCMGGCPASEPWPVNPGSRRPPRASSSPKTLACCSSHAAALNSSHPGCQAGGLQASPCRLSVSRQCPAATPLPTPRTSPLRLMRVTCLAWDLMQWVLATPFARSCAAAGRVSPTANACLRNRRRSGGWGVCAQPPIGNKRGVNTTDSKRHATTPANAGHLRLQPICRPVAPIPPPALVYSSSCQRRITTTSHCASSVYIQYLSREAAASRPHSRRAAHGRTMLCAALPSRAFLVRGVVAGCNRS